MRLFLFLRVARAEAQRKGLIQVPVKVGEGSLGGERTVAAADAEDRAARNRALFDVEQCLLEPVEARRHIDRAERAGVTEFFAPLLLQVHGAGMEAEHRCSVDVARRKPLIVPPAGDAGDSAVAERHINVHFENRLFPVADRRSRDC